MHNLGRNTTHTAGHRTSEHEVWAGQDFDSHMHGDRYRGKYAEWHQYLWWVLIDKTSGDVLLTCTGSGAGEWNGGIQKIAHMVWASDRRGSGSVASAGHSTGSGQKREEDIAWRMRNGRRPRWS